jgi:Zn-finger nucleic acid-binding protein
VDCPVCRQALIVVEREKIELDWCLECRGLWFDEGELEILAERSGRRLDPHDVGDSSGVPVTEKARRCPRCRRKMQKVFVGPDRPVLVDRCGEHGLWLDRGELGKIMRQLTSTGTSDEALILRFLGETFEQAVSVSGEGPAGGPSQRGG